MVLILCIETSGEVCSVALFRDEVLLSKAERFEKNIHASVITILIEEVIKQAGLSLGNLNAIAISKGPGSYTGLRVGVSAAKGLCYALSVPLVSVPTLQAMAHGFLLKHNISRSALICPMIDARRMEVFAAIYDSSLNELLSPRAEILTETSFTDFNHKEIYFTGSGACKMTDLTRHFKNAVIDNSLSPSALYMGHLAGQAFKNGLFENVAYFEPFYLKDFVGTGKAGQA